MKLKTILLIAFVTTSVVTKAQILNSVIGIGKDAVMTNTKVSGAVNTAGSVINTAGLGGVVDAAISNSTAVIDKAKGAVQGHHGLTNDEVIEGLKEALTIGTNNSSTLASQANGFLNNPKVFIPWPAEAKDMKAKLIKLGMQKKVTEFETSLNRAAEEASKKASPVFVDAITSMSIGDGFQILKGSDSSATHYLRENTFTPLKAQFMPIVKDAIAKTKVTALWAPLASTYNKIPGVKKQNTDLNDYVCTKAINGLMTLIMEEEAKIRKDPLARVTDTLKKVFGFKK
jgi:hypothetical protein